MYLVSFLGKVYYTGIHTKSVRLVDENLFL